MTIRTLWLLIAVAATSAVVWRTTAQNPRPVVPIALAGAAAANPYAETVFAFTFESRGFYRVPPHLRLVVTEWLPCLDLQRQGRAPAIDFAVDGFVTEWSLVHNAALVLGGETVHNPNDVPVRAFGYFIDPDEHMTDRDRAMILQENADAILERLEDMQTILANRSQTQVEDSVIEILSRALHQSVVEHVNAEFQTRLKKEIKDTRSNPSGPPSETTPGGP